MKKSVMLPKRIAVIFLFSVIVFLQDADAQNLPPALREAVQNYLEQQFMSASRCQGRTIAIYKNLNTDSPTAGDTLYLWVFQACFVPGQHGPELTRAVSIPVRIRVSETGGTVNVQECTFPMDGADYSADVRRLFPPEIAGYIFDSRKHQADIQQLRLRAEQRAKTLFQETHSQQTAPSNGFYAGKIGSTPFILAVKRDADSLVFRFVNLLYENTKYSEYKPFRVKPDPQGAFVTSLPLLSGHAGTFTGRINGHQLTGNWFDGTNRSEFSFVPLSSPDTTQWKNLALTPDGLNIKIPPDWGVQWTEEDFPVWSRPFSLDLYPGIQEQHLRRHAVVTFPDSRIDIRTTAPGQPCNSLIRLPEPGEKIRLFQKNIGNTRCRIMVAEEGAAGSIHKNIIYILKTGNPERCLVIDLNFSTHNPWNYGDPLAEKNIPVYDENRVILNLETMIRTLETGGKQDKR